MRLTIRTDKDPEPFDFRKLLRDGECHYVSVAMPGLTILSALMRSAGGFDDEQVMAFMMTVNRAQETGTLFPGVNITLLPSPSAKEGGYSNDEVIAHILDAFEANSLYIKSEKIFFDFRHLTVSEHQYVSCLKEAINQLPNDESIEIITWEPD